MADLRKFALVTGASSGIGAAFARLAAKSGCDVGLVARRIDRLQSIADEIKSAFAIDALPIEADLAAPAAADDVLSRLGRRGVDVLVNNAGYSIPNGFIHTSIEEQRKFLELTVMTPVALCRSVLPHMTRIGRGRIINISSITAFSTGGKGHTLYPAAKSFLVKFSMSLSAEVTDKGINVSAVCPGFVDTEFQIANKMADKAPPPPKFFTQSASAIADEAWRRNERGVELIVPGLLPKAAAVFLQYAPQALVTPMTRKAAARHYIGD